MKIVPDHLKDVVNRVVGGFDESNRRRTGPPGPATISTPTKSAPITPVMRAVPTPDDSAPLGPAPALNLAMIVGAQRSGTTWLQLLCAAHPKIAGGEELHLFSRYMGHTIAAFYTDKRAFSDAGRAQGLPCIMSNREFDAAVRHFATTVFNKLLTSKPGAELAIEKTPDHVLHLHYIRHLFPSVKVIHVIRDPRDVVVSQLAAASSWGEDWAPKSVAEAAERWVEWVQVGRKYAESPTYTELRYETLHRDGPKELERIYEFLGYPLPAEQVARIFEQFTMANIKAGKAPNVLVINREKLPIQPAAAAPKPADDGAGSNGAGSNGAAAAPAATLQSLKPPEGFYRKGKAGGWRESLTADEVRTIEQIAGPLMRELGYALESTSVAEPVAATAAVANA